MTPHHPICIHAVSGEPLFMPWILYGLTVAAAFYWAGYRQGARIARQQVTAQVAANLDRLLSTTRYQ